MNRFGCLHCSKTFKNKNEAKRHQQSQHIRNQSWSCGAIVNYGIAFHPKILSKSQKLNEASSDICLYCGDEFSNFPQRNWDQRLEHLSGIHKFDDCNQEKKFFRADHFRQHIKHSHTGRSGTWTSILENVCMKDKRSSRQTEHSDLSRPAIAPISPPESFSQPSSAQTLFSFTTYPDVDTTRPHILPQHPTERILRC